MDFRVIKRKATRIGLVQMGRFSRQSLLAALTCAFLGTSALAQDTLDFVDPLNDERTRVEQGDSGAQPSQADRWRATPQAPADGTASSSSREDSAALLMRAREGATSSAAAAQEQASGFWSRMSATLSSIAAALGISTLALIALLFLLLVGLALLVGWTLFRGQSKYSMSSRHHADYDEDDEDDLYAHDARNVQGRRKQQDDPARPATVAPAKKRNTAFEEKAPDDFDAIFAEESVAKEPVKPEPKETYTPPPKETVEDSTTWRKPNLDRLRDSIKSDWMASKSSKKRTAKASALAATTADPGDRRLSEISDGWEEWDGQVKPEDDPWGETLEEKAPETNNDDALRRIRALRQSLRAS